MIPPQEAARRLLWAVAIGAALGLCYELLRPLRRRGNAVGDLIFVVAALYGWVCLSFGICAGDVRFAGTVAMGIGAALWEWLPGRLLRPVYAKIVAFLRGTLAWLLRPWQKIFKKRKNFSFSYWHSAKNGLQ